MSCGKEVGAKQCLLKKHFECQAAEFGLNPASERVACDFISKGVGSDSKESAMQETQVQSQGQEDSLERRMATHSSILTLRIP